MHVLLAPLYRVLSGEGEVRVHARAEVGDDSVEADDAEISGLWSARRVHAARGEELRGLHGVVRGGSANVMHDLGAALPPVHIRVGDQKYVRRVMLDHHGPHRVPQLPHVRLVLGRVWEVHGRDDHLHAGGLVLERLEKPGPAQVLLVAVRPVVPLRAHAALAGRAERRPELLVVEQHDVVSAVGRAPERTTRSEHPPSGSWWSVLPVGVNDVREVHVVRLARQQLVDLGLRRQAASRGRMPRRVEAPRVAFSMGAKLQRVDVSDARRALRRRLPGWRRHRLRRRRLPGQRSRRPRSRSLPKWRRRNLRK
mmetsp:Transcript_86962/g.243752  ORF Transcript_86962/g.243752 Transcript_86962/m.243752 type:complete len:310 (-) Transcript_86962:444-1373(-)